MSIPNRALLAIIASSPAFVTAFDYPLDIAGLEKVPAGASWNVPHDFASFSLPAHWFADYTGMY